MNHIERSWFLALFVLAGLISCAMPEDLGLEDGTASHPYQISSPEELNAVRGGVAGYEDWDLSDSYILTADIDLSGFVWTPIGSIDDGFSGTFDGNGHTISNLTINAGGSWTGLFRQIGLTGAVKDVNLTNADVTGRQWVGILVGRNYGYITGSHTAGSVAGSEGSVGGMAGECGAGLISSSSSSAVVTSSKGYAGGLVGYHSGGIIEESRATGNVIGKEAHVGGFVGYQNGEIRNCYASGNVKNQVEFTGGFSGTNGSQKAVLINCYSAGTVSVPPGVDAAHVGGFVAVTSGEWETGKVVNCSYSSSLAGVTDDYAVDMSSDDLLTLISRM